MASLEVFEQNRGRMFGIAYRMLGTATEAEDILQDAWLRWQGTDTDAVREPSAFLATIVTRLSLTALDSARARREIYVGPWLPEPVATGTDPALGAETREALSFAILLLLERLSPAERAAYVLHEAFGYPFRQVAELLEVSEANARQLATRARAHLDRERHAVVNTAERDRLLGAFLAAAQAGDLGTLESMLAEDALALSDGGGIVSAARKPVVGRDRVARFILGVMEKYAHDLTMVPVQANGELALLGLRDGDANVMVTVEIGPNGVSQLFVVLNPQKLEKFADAIVSQF